MVGIPTPVTVKERTYIERRDPFHCDRWCGNVSGMDPSTQASRRCTLPGFRRRWTETSYRDRGRLNLWMGRQPFNDDEGQYHHRPGEPADEGCPGGWARCGFARSFSKYIRARLKDGGHDTNPRVDRLGPDQDHILDALQYFEQQYSHAEAEFQRQSR